MKSEMKTHFDNQVIPFVDLGSDVTASYKTDKYFYRISATGTLDATLISTIKTTFTTAGYTTKSETSSSLRMDHASGFSLRVTQGTNTLIYMDIMYFEPYDKTSVTTYSDQKAYTDLLASAHCENIPFIYLGSKKVTATSDSTGHFLTGGRASDTFLADVKASLDKANESLTAPDTWDIVKESKNGSYYYKATRTDYLNNITILRISTTSIGVDLDGNDLSLCTMQLSYSPAVIPTDWSDAVKEEMKHELDDQTVPFLNIGTLQDDGYGSSKFCYKKDSASGMNFYRMIGKGYTLDETRVNSYETALTAEGYTTKSKDTDSLISENATTGISIRITADATLAKTIYLDVQYYEPYNKTGVTSYGDDVDDMISMFDVDDVPFIYLGTKKASFATSDDTYYIKGGKASSTFFDDAKASLAAVNATKTEESQKWTVTDETDTTIGAYVKAVRTNSDSSTDTMKIYTITGEGKDFSGNDIKICALGLEHNVPAPTGIWSNSIKTNVFAKLGGHELPYLNLNDPHKQYKGLFKGDGKATIEAATKSTWTDTILDSSEAAFKNDTSRTDVAAGTTWNVTKDKADHKLTASISFTDGYSMNVEVARVQDEDEDDDWKPIDNSYHAEVTIVYAQTPATTGWSNTVKNFFTTNLDGHALPYFDIKDSDPYPFYDEGYGSITAADGTWNDSILTDAQAAFDNDTSRTDVASGTTWTVTNNEDDEYVKASITFSDGCKMTVKVQSVEDDYDDDYHCDISITFTQHS